MGQCKDCRWWFGGNNATPTGWHMCRLASTIENEWPEGVREDARETAAGVSKLMATTSAPSAGMRESDLFTAPDFGCVQFTGE